MKTTRFVGSKRVRATTAKNFDALRRLERFGAEALDDALAELGDLGVDVARGALPPDWLLTSAVGFEIDRGRDGPELVLGVREGFGVAPGDPAEYFVRYERGWPRGKRKTLYRRQFLRPARLAIERALETVVARKIAERLNR